MVYLDQFVAKIISHSPRDVLSKLFKESYCKIVILGMKLGFAECNNTVNCIHSNEVLFILEEGGNSTRYDSFSHKWE